MTTKLFELVSVARVTTRDGDEVFDVIGTLLAGSTPARDVGLCRCESEFAATIMCDWWAKQTHEAKLEIPE